MNIREHRETVGVAISGGLDSTVILHNVSKANRVNAYTMKWGHDEVEAEAARVVAEAYNAKLTIVEFTKDAYMEALRECMKTFDKPRWNLWPYMIMKAAHADGVKHFYIGEGCDEIYGYQDRPYLEGWIGLLEYHWPTWKQAADIFKIHLHAPFMEMETSLKERIGKPVTLAVANGRFKEALWDEYKFQLRCPVLYPKKPMAPTYYDLLGMSKQELQILATKEWLNGR